MLLAGADDVAPGDACEEVARSSAAPGAVKIVLYSGAQHAFDVSELPPRMTYRFGTIGYHPAGRRPRARMPDVDRVAHVEALARAASRELTAAVSMLQRAS